MDNILLNFSSITKDFMIIEFFIYILHSTSFPHLVHYTWKFLLTTQKLSKLARYQVEV